MNVVKFPYSVCHLEKESATYSARAITTRLDTNTAILAQSNKKSASIPGVYRSTAMVSSSWPL
jgi:hypothetical protein